MDQSWRKRKEPGQTSRSRPGGGKKRKMQKIGQPEPNSDLTYGPETDLKTITTCPKNPGHPTFIPVTQFTTEDLSKALPEESEESKALMVKYIKAWAELTVYLKARQVSTERPTLWRDTDLPYPSRHARGGFHTRTGSGYVGRVVKCGEGSEDHHGETCPCKGCSSSSNPKKTWWEVHVSTARHVTFDQTEVKGTEISFFLDERESVGSVCVVRSGSEGNVYKGHEVVVTNTEIDFCLFYLITHDEKVVDRLEKALNCVDELRWRPDVEELFVKHRPTFMIGHPHGCSKHITVGREVEWVDKGSDGRVVRYSSLIHSASTCPGCSGGPVLGWVEGYGWFDLHSPHSEGLWDGNAMTAGWWWRW